MNFRNVYLYTVKGTNVVPMLCKKVLNKCKLDWRVDMVWREELDADSGVKPVWRVLYKPPLKKRTGDLQWRTLHGAIAISAFISVINPTISRDCPFCGEIETVFHCIYECKRFCKLFDVVENVFRWFDERWSKTAFILGVGYKKAMPLSDNY